MKKFIFLFSFSSVLGLISFFDLSFTAVRKSVIILFVFSSGFYATKSSAQILITHANNFSYNQLFNTLGSSSSDITWTNNVTLPGWYAAGDNQSDGVDDNPGVPAFFATYRGNSGGTSTGGFYSYGNNGDRALGAVNQDDVYGNIAYGALFQNDSGEELRSVSISMLVEQWRRPATGSKAHQRIKLCYAVGNPVPIAAAWMLDSAQFVELPEGNLTNDDTTTMLASQPLDGNLSMNSHTVNVTFPLSIPAGSQFFLRFLDENATGTDVVFGVDDLTITFSNDECDRITAVSGATVFACIDMGMTLDIPDVGSPHSYIVPSDGDMSNWLNILTNFYQGNWDLVDAPAAAYGYVLTSYTQQNTPNSYYILRKINSSPYFWGTFAKAVTPQNQKLVIESPHPVNDDYTGRQAAAVWWLTGAENLIIAGTGRCLAPDTEPSPCTGESGTCHPSGDDEPYRQSDVAHAKQTIFHLATTVLANLNPSAVFVQLHGFAQKASQPDHFYISCGTQDALLKSVPDYPVMVREKLKTEFPIWDLQITHVDDNGTLGASDNTQGRFLNLHNPFIQYCEDSGEPVTVTNRFLHLEQYPKFRKAPCYYPLMAAALGSTINTNEYVRQIRITDVDAAYNQTFDNLPEGQNSGPTHTWGNNLHIPGVYAVRGVVGLFSNYITDDGSSNAGGLYSYGTSPDDRALGSLNTTTTGNIAYGFLFRNDTGAPIYGIDLTYTAEQWRKVNGQVQHVKLSYTIGAAIDLTSNGLLNDILFTNVPAGDLISIDNTGNGSVDGNQTKTTISSISIPLVLNDGQEIFIRFLDEDVGGSGTSDNAMALDDVTVSFSAVPLPVTWRDFEVKKSGKHAVLNWTADLEKECDHYEVQRSENGKEFQRIATLSCQNLVNANHYEFRDTPPMFSPLVYYRVCQYDFDGTFTCSQIRAFRHKVHPVPSVSYQNGSVLIQTSQEGKPEFVSVMDYMGRQLAEGKPSTDSNNQYRIPCSLPPNQLVIVRITFSNGTYVSRIRTAD